ncbi:hypothetical protein GJ744_010635 [Endocarpon pusillum]|uniref:Uncharacterized protein n=1 Tax=Endocarpon pusillum TaxID=364733 RepID=A0A8H7ARX0_9EURO|nr:hypothetical protein GJ744_010635 [Endocarpon pusillum]
MDGTALMEGCMYNASFSAGPSGSIAVQVMQIIKLYVMSTTTRRRGRDAGIEGNIVGVQLDVGVDAAEEFVQYLQD